jgi:putative acetyltransferase
VSILKELDGQGCTLVGDPNYYKRFGFRNIPDLVHEGIPQEVFLALPFTEKVHRELLCFMKDSWQMDSNRINSDRLAMKRNCQAVIWIFAA